MNNYEVGQVIRTTLFGCPWRLTTLTGVDKPLSLMTPLKELSKKKDDGHDHALQNEPSF